MGDGATAPIWIVIEDMISLTSPASATRGADPVDGVSMGDDRPVVCHVLHSLHVGGGEILARSFALKHEAQFKPVFALLDDLGALGRELDAAGYAVEVMKRRPGFDLGCARRL